MCSTQFAQSEMRHSSSLPHRLNLFEPDMRKFNDLIVSNAQNDWNHADITFIAQISREILIYFIIFFFFFYFHSASPDRASVMHFVVDK